MNVVIHHNEDLDGWTSGYIAKLALGEAYMIGKTNAHPDLCGWELSKCRSAEQVIVTDFCLPTEQMYDINQHTKLTWIDHHQTNIDRIDPRLIHTVHTDITKSASELAYIHLNFDEDSRLSKLVGLVDTYDMWRQEHPSWEDARALNAAFHLISKAEYFEYIKGKDYRELIRTGLTLIKKDKVDCSQYKFYRCCIKGHTCDVVNHIHPELSLRPRAMDILLMYRIEGGKVKCSLRSVDEDVSVIASYYGGGGHKHAAGFTCSLEELSDILTCKN